MLECWPVGNSSYDKPIKHPVSKISPVELIAELIEVLLQELVLDSVVHVPEQAFRICCISNICCTCPICDGYPHNDCKRHRLFHALASGATRTMTHQGNAWKILIVSYYISFWAKVPTIEDIVKYRRLNNTKMRIII